MMEVVVTTGLLELSLQQSLQKKTFTTFFLTHGTGTTIASLGLS